jgi:DnaK suppressor protein
MSAPNGQSDVPLYISPWIGHRFQGLEPRNFRDDFLQGEFMEKATIEKFKNLFLEILSEEEVFEGKLSPTSLEGDEVDVVSTEKANQMDFRLKSRNAIYLNKVRKSLQKIEEGTFGECEDCGASISQNRLLARPTADLCIHCKEAQEKQENQMVNKNRASSKVGRVLPIENLQKGYNKDETSTSSFHVNHMDYQDIVG